MPELHDSITEPERASTASPTLPRMTEEEFEAWCPEDVRAEWVDGQVIVMSPGNFRHVDLTGFLLAVLRSFVEKHDLGAILGSEFPIRMSFAQGTSRRLPDILFLGKRRLNLIRPTYLDGAPDVIIEVVSPESTARDWREKYLEYQAAGVHEYWVIDPQARRLEAYGLDSDAAYLRIKENKGRVVSAVLPGFFMKPAWLRRKNLPKVHEVLGELGV